ncbi:MAG: IS110 family transposase [Myxococcales bacterium]|nr:IS110 family transposase [Myxococcales bacterium]
MHDETSTIPEIARLTTIPAVGERVATMIHAWVGDVRRFRSARELASYAGLVPSVWQSDKAHRTGGITKEGSAQVACGPKRASTRCPSRRAGPSAP